MKSCGFHAWNLADYMVRTYGCIPNEPKIQHSVVDLVLSCISVLVLIKNTGFSGRPWNPAVFMMISGSFSDEKYSIKWISPWNLADFMHEIWQISCPEIWRISYIWQISWNPPDFRHEIWRISCLKSARISYANLCRHSGPMKSRWISSMKSGGFHPWNQADFMADLEKCKLENVKFITLITFFSM